MKKSKRLSPDGTLPVPWLPWENRRGRLSFYQELYEDLKDNPEFLETYASYLLREAGDDEGAWSG